MPKKGQKKAPSDSLSKGMVFKEQGNEAFTGGKFSKAIELYSLAIESEPENPVFYSNRSAAYFQLEEYEKALEDAVKSYELDPEYSKAAYRKAIALFELDHLEVPHQ